MSSVELEIQALGFEKVSGRVYYSENKQPVFDKNTIDLLEKLNKHSNESVMRLCMHTDPQDDVHEMLMIQDSFQQVGPLRQNRNSSVSYMLLKGELEIIQYHNKSGQSERFHLSDEIYALRYCRLEASVFRQITTFDRPAIFMEVASGPFDDSDTIWM